MKKATMELQTIQLLLNNQKPINPMDFNLLFSLFRGLIITPEMESPFDFEELARSNLDYATVLAKFRGRSKEADWLSIIKNRLELSEWEQTCLEFRFGNQNDILAINQYDVIIQTFWNVDINEQAKNTQKLNLNDYINNVVEEHQQWLDHGDKEED